MAKRAARHPASGSPTAPPQPGTDWNHPLLLDDVTLTLEEWHRLRDEADMPFMPRLRERAARLVA